jgi:hypothetical protein
MNGRQGSHPGGVRGAQVSFLEWGTQKGVIYDGRDVLSLRDLWITQVETSLGLESRAKVQAKDREFETTAQKLGT